jgi:F-type H+-transporting ATPase subunit b
MFTETFYIALAFVVFFAMLYKFGVHKTMIAAIDDRAVQIQAELDEAKRLNEEAQALLTSITARKKTAETEATAIIAEAHEEAKRIAKDSSLKLEEFIARRAKQAELKIAQAEAQAIQDVRVGAAELATKMASHLMAGEASNADLITKGIAQVRTQMN